MKPEATCERCQLKDSLRWMLHVMGNLTEFNHGGNKSSPEESSMEEPGLCLWVRCEDTGKAEVISEGEAWCMRSCKAFLLFWGTEEKMLPHLHSCLSFETLLIPFLPSLLANTASICELVWVLVCFLILYSYMILDFTPTPSYRVWRFSWEFWSSFFHIIFYNITTTSEIHSIMHKDDIPTFLQPKTTGRGVGLTHTISIFF